MVMVMTGAGVRVCLAPTYTAKGEKIVSLRVVDLCFVFAALLLNRTNFKPCVLMFSQR
jgi:hypothetical protein